MSPSSCTISSLRLSCRADIRCSSSSFLCLYEFFFLKKRSDQFAISAKAEWLIPHAEICPPPLISMLSAWNDLFHRAIVRLKVTQHFHHLWEVGGPQDSPCFCLLTTFRYNQGFLILSSSYRSSRSSASSVGFCWAFSGVGWEACSCSSRRR